MVGTVWAVGKSMLKNALPSGRVAAVAVALLLQLIYLVGIATYS